MLVATHNNSRHVRLYRVEVDWTKQSFVIEHVKTIADCSSTSQDAGEDGLPPSLPYPESQLYHLDLVSPAPDVRSKDTFPPLLLAFFCNESHRDDYASMGSYPSTSIVRWELISIKPTLHPSFSQLASKRSNASNSSEPQVRPRVAYELRPFILTLHSQNQVLGNWRISI